MVTLLVAAVLGFVVVDVIRGMIIKKGIILKIPA
jgi:hypothetical protein